MKNKLLKTTGKLLILIALLLGSLTSIATASLRSNYAITVGEDRRVYIIDLNKSKVIKKSDVFPEMGLPTSIDFDKRNGRLYVASELGPWQRVYYPLVILEIKGNSIKLIDKFKLEEGEPLGEFETVWPIYKLKLAPGGKKIFAMYAHPKYRWSNPAYGGGSVDIDTSTGNITRMLSFRIRQLDSMFSPDGKMVCKIRPPSSRIIRKDGKEIIKKWAGDVVTYDIEKNKETERIAAKDLFASGRGFNPPWGKIDTPLIRVEIMGFRPDPGFLIAYDRLTGKEIFKIDLRDASGRPLSLSDYVLLLPDNKNKALIPMAGGYLGIINLKEKKLDAKIKIGSVSTNVVLGYTRLNYTLLIIIIAGAILIIALAVFFFIRTRRKKKAATV